MFAPCMLFFFKRQRRGTNKLHGYAEEATDSAALQSIQDDVVGRGLSSLYNTVYAEDFYSVAIFSRLTIPADKPTLLLD